MKHQTSNAIATFRVLFQDDVSSVQPEYFQGRESFVESGHPDKYFVKNTRKKAAQGKYN